MGLGGEEGITVGCHFKAAHFLLKFVFIHTTRVVCPSKICPAFFIVALYVLSLTRKDTEI